MNNILTQTKNHIYQLFETEDCSKLFFHDYQHTVEVVQTIRTIHQALKIEPPKALLLEIAAWFHDVGYLYTYHQHEAKSIALAKAFLTSQKVAIEDIDFVCTCIATTELALVPTTLYQALLKDADLAFGVTNHFFDRGPLLRKEWEVQLDKYYTEEEWQKLQYNFISNVEFFSAYGQQHFLPISQQNKIKMEKL